MYIVRLVKRKKNVRLAIEFRKRRPERKQTTKKRFAHVSQSDDEILKKKIIEENIKRDIITRKERHIFAILFHFFTY